MASWQRIHLLEAKLAAKQRWAAVWKERAKYHRDKADRYFAAWIKVVVQLGWKSRWSRVWKQAAKRHRRAKYLVWFSLLDTKVRYRDSWHWSGIWKSKAKQLRAELAEQRGRYDKLLAEHEALQALLHTLEAE